MRGGSGHSREMDTITRACHAGQKSLWGKPQDLEVAPPGRVSWGKAAQGCRVWRVFSSWELVTAQKVTPPPPFPQEPSSPPQSELQGAVELVLEPSSQEGTGALPFIMDRCRWLLLLPRRRVLL